MERLDPIMLRAREVARRRFEYSRLGVGLRGAWPVVVVILIATIIHGHVGAEATLPAAALGFVVVAAGWRGGSWRRGALAGLLAGVAPLVIPVLVLSFGGAPHCAACDPSSAWNCTLLCFFSSLVAGFVVGRHAADDRQPYSYVAIALATAVMTGLLSCGATGIGGAAGILIGQCAGSATAMALFTSKRTA